MRLFGALERDVPWMQFEKIDVEPPDATIHNEAEAVAQLRVAASGVTQRFSSMESNTIRSSSPKSGYSATVEMFLDIAGVRHDVSHMGPEFVILARPVNCPPCEAVVGLNVDGRLKQWPVRLPEGISEVTSCVRTAKAA